jgi:pimeloyl-ACP methyl ester carboxylesterase
MSDGLLLIHAFPMDASMWEEQILADVLPRERVVAPNLPGFGGTEPAPMGVMTMAIAARACLEALDEAGVQRAVVCGLSMGGYVAMELWHAAPERVAGYVFANTRSQADTPEAAEGRHRLAERLLTEGNVLVASPPPLLSDRASEALHDRVRHTIADQPVSAIAAAAIGMSRRHDYTESLGTIDVPTLVVTSDLDTLIPPEVTASIAERVPGATLQTIEGAGHLSNLEAPERFTELLVEHVRRCGVEP